MNEVEQFIASREPDPNHLIILDNVDAFDRRKSIHCVISETDMSRVRPRNPIRRGANARSIVCERLKEICKREFRPVTGTIPTTTPSAQNLSTRSLNKFCRRRHHHRCPAARIGHIRCDQPQPEVVQPTICEILFQHPKQCKLSSYNFKREPSLHLGTLRKQDIVRYVREVGKSTAIEIMEEVYATDDCITDSDEIVEEDGGKVVEESINEDAKADEELNDREIEKDYRPEETSVSGAEKEAIRNNIFLDSKAHVLSYPISVLLDVFTMEYDACSGMRFIRIKTNDSVHRLRVLCNTDEGDAYAFELTNLIEMGKHSERLLLSTDPIAKQKLSSVAFLVIREHVIRTDTRIPARHFSAQLQIALSRECRYIRPRSLACNEDIVPSRVTQLESLILEAADAVSRIPKSA